jgi:hypothetical protein
MRNLTGYNTRKKHSATKKKSAVKKNSIKKRSVTKKRSAAKRRSVTKSSVTKSSAAKMRSVTKSSVTKRSVKKKSVKKRSIKKSSAKQKYNMRGMGILLNMYGGAIESSEESAAKEKKILEDLKTLLFNTKDKTEQEKIKTKIENQKMIIQKSQEKLKNLLRGVSDTAYKAVKSLTQDVGKKIDVNVEANKLKQDVSSITSKLSSSFKF